MFDRAMGAALDRYITGNYGEDQFRGQEDFEEFLEHTCSRCFMQRLGLACPAYERYFVEGDDNYEEMENCLVVKGEMKRIEDDNRAMDEAMYQQFLDETREEQEYLREEKAARLIQEYAR